MDAPKDSETIYRFTVEGLTEDQHLTEDIPHEYRVVRLESVASGVMIWGRYKDRWYPNPSTRYLIARLLSEKLLDADEYRAALKDVLDCFWDMSPLEYAASKGLPYMDDKFGNAVLDRARALLKEA